MKKVFLKFVCLLFVFNANAQALDSVVLSPQDHHWKIRKNLYYFEDKADTMSSNFVLSRTLPYEKNSNDVLNPGFTHSGYWIKFQTKNNGPARNLLLEISFPFLDTLEAFIPDSKGSFERHFVGDQMPWDAREVIHKNFVFEMNYEANETKIIYLHVKCAGEVTTIPVDMWSPLALDERDSMEQIDLGIYYGILLFALFLSIFLGFSLRERTHWYYFFYIIGIGFFQFSLEGLSFQYFWPNNNWMANHIIPMSGSFGAFFLVIFTQALLETRKHSIRFHKTLNAMATLMVLCFGVSLLPNPFYSLSIKLLNLFVLVNNIIIFITAVYLVRSKNASARYFLIAFSLLLLGVILLLLKNFGFLPRNVITEYGLQFGSAIEIILLSFALAERVKTLKNEKEEAQAKLLIELQEKSLMQEKINIELEIKVKERTREIEEQKHELEEKSEEITSSINYAKRIQRAIMPPLEEIAQHLPNSFVLFKPRDIVSGDFYWFSPHENFVLIAAADCTGHGVPGALMSMVGNAILNEVVNEKKIYTPSEILNHAREGIIKALKQTGVSGENKDGMDIALCKIDLNTKLVEFAGANNPLYVVRNAQLSEYKGDKQPIGIYGGTPKPFTNNSIQLQAGDSIYLFTDGFADQFGGPLEKKYMYKNFKELLAKHSEKTATEQMQIIDRENENWKGAKDQIDDVLVIGIKI